MTCLPIAWISVEQQVEQVEIGQIVDVIDDHRDQVDRLGGQALGQQVELVAECRRRLEHPLALVGRNRPLLGRKRAACDRARNARNARDIGDRRRGVTARR